MTIRHLKIFTAVADYGGMSKAAKMLHISQPSISQAVSELEKHYGVKLFERLSQKIYLTKEGELMLSFSRHILDNGLTVICHTDKFSIRSTIWKRR